jgi:hypothetical protein
MLAYFALYSLSGQLDELLDLKKAKHNMFESIVMSAVALQVALLIQIIRNFLLRKEISEAKGESANAGFLGATGLTTIFNALT